MFPHFIWIITVWVYTPTVSLHSCNWHLFLITNCLQFFSVLKKKNPHTKTTRQSLKSYPQMYIIIFFLPENQHVKTTKKISVPSTSSNLASPLSNCMYTFSNFKRIQIKVQYQQTAYQNSCFLILMSIMVGASIIAAFSLCHGNKMYWNILLSLFFVH